MSSFNEERLAALEALWAKAGHHDYHVGAFQSGKVELTPRGVTHLGRIGANNADAVGALVAAAPELLTELRRLQKADVERIEAIADADRMRLRVHDIEATLEQVKEEFLPIEQSIRRALDAPELIKPECGTLAFKMWTEMVARWFIDNGGKNYITVAMGWDSGAGPKLLAGRSIVLTAQLNEPGALTPAKHIEQLEVERDTARVERDNARSAWSDCEAALEAMRVRKNAAEAKCVGQTKEIGRNVAEAVFDLSTWLPDGPADTDEENGPGFTEAEQVRVADAAIKHIEAVTNERDTLLEEVKQLRVAAGEE